MKKVCIVGSRGIEDKSFIYKCISRFAGTNFHLLSGGAKGVDSIAENFADEHGLDKTIMIPDWSVGKFAGMLRNKELMDLQPDFVLIFWDGESRGTKNMIDLALNNHRNFLVIFVE